MVRTEKYRDKRGEVLSKMRDRSEVERAYQDNRRQPATSATRCHSITPRNDNESKNRKSTGKYVPVRGKCTLILVVTDISATTTDHTAWTHSDISPTDQTPHHQHHTQQVVMLAQLHAPVPMYRAFSCSVDIAAPPDVDMITDYYRPNTDGPARPRVGLLLHVHVVEWRPGCRY